MTKNDFIRATGITPLLAERWYHPVMVAMETCEINTPVRRAHFLAQAGVESGGFRQVQESLNYSIEGLTIFGPRLNVNQRARLGRSPGEKALSTAQQAEIAELVYGGRYGNDRPGDGWKYRGRGLKQITFRDNYRACGKALGLDLEDNPDLLLSEMNAACSAGWFWQTTHCNALADKDDVSALTRRINGGFNGLHERTKRTLQAMFILLPEHE